MKNWLVHFTTMYTDMHGGSCICEGALPFMASEDDAYFIATAIAGNMSGATFSYLEEVVP